MTSSRSTRASPSLSVASSSTAASSAFAWTGALLLALFLVTGCKESKNPKCERTPQNVPRGGFTFVPNALPRREAPSTSSLADCNGDGLLDVLRPEDGVLLIAKPDGTFRSQPLLFPVHQALMQDLDGDGLTDLILAGFGIRRGTGNCTFEDEIRPFGGHGSALAIRVQDVNRDGLDDIVETLTGNPGTPPFLIRLARGDGTFDDITIEGAGIGNVATTGLPVFNSFLHDVDGDGITDGFFLSDAGTSWFSWGVAGAVPTFTRDDRVTSILAPINPMSMTVLDADRDGHIDYFFSGTIDGNVLLRGGSGRSLQNEASDVCLQERTEPLSDSWTSLAFDADFDGWMDLMVLKKPLNLTPDDLTQRPGRPSVFLNQRDGAFLDVAASLEPTRVEGISMACGDLRSDGRVSCYVDGNTATSLLLNQIEQTNPWVGVRLRGTVSGITAAGSLMSVDDVQPPRVYLSGVQAGTYTTHTLDVLIAANLSSPDTNVTIAWPSGIQQQVKSLPLNKYTTVREPEVFQISRRVAPADGKSTIDIVLRPQLAEAREATVELEGAGAWAGPLTYQDEGSVTRTLVAPSTKGVATLQISLDGKPLQVHPRVLFE